MNEKKCTSFSKMLKVMLKNVIGTFRLPVDFQAMLSERETAESAFEWKETKVLTVVFLHCLENRVRIMIGNHDPTFRCKNR